MGRIRRWVERAHRDQRASLEVIAPFGLLIILICVGLVHDGGRMMTAKRDTLNSAAAIARDAAMELDENHYRATGQMRVDASLAAARINYHANLRNNMDVVSWNIEGDTRVVVEVRTQWAPTILKNVGAREIRGEAAANLLGGIAEGN